MSRDLIQEGGRVIGTQIMSQGMPTPSSSWLEARHILHWLKKGTKWRCCAFCEKEAEYDSLCMSEMQCGIVCCAMF